MGVLEVVGSEELREKRGWASDLGNVFVSWMVLRGKGLTRSKGFKGGKQPSVAF